MKTPNPTVGTGPAKRLAVECEAVSLTYRGATLRNVLHALMGRPLPEGQEPRVLDGVSLAVPEGQMTGVLGRNGAGKSSLLRVLGGILPPSNGTIRLHGDTAGLFELGGLGNRFITGRQYADRLLRLQGVPRQSRPTLMREIHEFSELEDYFDKRILTYSSGMAARLYFSVAMAVRHQNYLIDEILSVGDEHFQTKCWRLLRDRLGNGASGVLVTHDWAATVKLCRESHILEHGRLSFSGTSHEVVAQYLQVPVVQHPNVRFEALPEAIEAISGQNWSVPITVASHPDIECEFACSVEALRLGIGWEILLLSGFETVPASAGLHAIRIDIQRLPLAAGKYSLNLFLRSKAQPGRPPEILDQRSWTTGNPIALRVTGSESSTLPRLSLDWRFDDISHGHAQHQA